MSKLLTRDLVAEQGRIVAAPEVPVREPTTKQTVVDRTFELPTALYGATVGCYLAFLGIMGFGFANPGLIIPMAIFTILVFAGFGVPAMWARMQPENPARPMTWGRFGLDGIATSSGRLRARDAAAQVLILPVLIVLWGCVVVTIAALV